MLNRTRASAVMSDQGLDALLASSLQNVFYLSGFWNETFLTSPSTSSAYALVVKDELDAPSVAANVGDPALPLESCPPPARITYFGTFFYEKAPDVELHGLDREIADRVIGRQQKANSFEALVAILEERGATSGVVGYDERGIGETVLRELTSRFPRVEFRPANSVFRLIRSVKTEDEVRRLHAAVALTEDAVRAAMSVAQPGATEEEMAREFHKTIAAGGGRPLLSLIYTGSRSAIGRLLTGSGVLRSGDIVRFDVGCWLDGYCSDIARSYAIGEPDERARKLYAATVAGEDAALQALRPGVKASEIFKIGVEGVRAAGIPHYRRHHIGHGVGLEVYDPPLIGPNDQTVLEEGMVFEIETPYYEVGLAGFHPEDTVVVTRDGSRVLSTLSRELVFTP